MRQKLPLIQLRRNFRLTGSNLIVKNCKPLQEFRLILHPPVRGACGKDQADTGREKREHAEGPYIGDRKKRGPDQYPDQDRESFGAVFFGEKIFLHDLPTLTCSVTRPNTYASISRTTAIRPNIALI